MAGNLPVESDPPNRVAFVHAILDEAGFSPAEFRVYGHVARAAGDEGECFTKIENIAKICRLSLPTTRKALKSLASRHFIQQKRRDGQTTLYKPTPLSDLQGYIKITPLQKHDKAGVEIQPTPLSDLQATPIKRRPLSISPEVYPSKSILLNKPVALNLGTVKLTPAGRRTHELMQRCCELFGDAEMKRSECHKRWYHRAETAWDKLDSVLNEVRDVMKREALDNPAAYAENLWQNWQREN